MNDMEKQSSHLINWTIGAMDLFHTAAVLTRNNIFCALSLGDTLEIEFKRAETNGFSPSGTNMATVGKRSIASYSNLKILVTLTGFEPMASNSVPS